MKEFKTKLVKFYDYNDLCKEVIEIDFMGFGRKGGRKGRKSNEVSSEDRKRNYKRIKRNTRRICLANDLGQIHLVLTYKINMQDVDKADEQFKKFIFELRKYYPSLLYLATREFQKENEGRYSLHYHVLLNQRIDLKKVNLIWNKQEVLKPDHRQEDFRGFAFIVAHENQLKAIMYALKYISKEVGEVVFKSEKGHTKKSYLLSQGLKKEVEACTSKFLIHSPEGYFKYTNELNMLMSDIPAKWDLSFEIDVDTSDGSKKISGRSLMLCYDMAC